MGQLYALSTLCAEHSDTALDVITISTTVTYVARQASPQQLDKLTHGQAGWQRERVEAQVDTGHTTAQVTHTHTHTHAQSAASYISSVPSQPMKASVQNCNS